MDQDLSFINDQGSKLYLSQHTLDMAKAFVVAIVDGNVPLPMDQGQAENALMHFYLLPVLDLMIQYPDFLPVAASYYISQGGHISDDRDVSIFWPAAFVI